METKKTENNTLKKNWLDMTEAGIAKKIFMTVLSALLMSFPIATFVKSAELVPGGISGLTILIQRLFSHFLGIELPFGILNITLGLIPAVLAFFCVGKQFVLFSSLQILLMSFFVDLWPNIIFESDIFLNTVFAAVFTGFGVVTTLNAGLSTGGTDFIFMSISAKLGISLWNYAFLFNASLLVISAFIFGFKPAMYSVVYQYIVTKIISNYHARYMKRALLIIADDSEPISTDLMKLTNHAITEFQGIGKYTDEKNGQCFIWLLQKKICQK